MKWFSSNISTMEDLRREYRRLAKLHHPDAGGDTEDMKQINAEYDRLYAVLSRQEATQEKKEPQDTAAEDKAIRTVLDALVNVNATVEIVGCWVWVSEGSYPYRELLKSIGFKFAPKKKAWCWHYGEYRRHHKREVSLDEIREKYGSQKVNNRRERRAVAG
ncbi:hypothetical protein N510_003462 [Firmicutes bacterium ASF500]|nr:hypothetical protein N510_003462 [Firmicutes bacterium ASF500]